MISYVALFARPNVKIISEGVLVYLNRFHPASITSCRLVTSPTPIEEQLSRPIVVFVFVLMEPRRRALGPSIPAALAGGGGARIWIRNRDRIVVVVVVVVFIAVVVVVVVMAKSYVLVQLPRWYISYTEHSANTNEFRQQHAIM